MNKSQYKTYLKSAHWQNVKNQYYKTHEYICVKCGHRRMLQLHHLTYERIGRERMSDLIYLCATCHQREHGLIPKVKKKLGWKKKLVICAVLVWVIVRMWFY